MTEEQKPPMYYRPAQVAARLGVTVKTLSYMRSQGKIEGTDFGNLTLYTEEQVQAADLTRKKPGPKAGEGSRRGRARYSWPSDQHSTGDATEGDTKSSSVASSRKRGRIGHRKDLLLAVGA